MVYLSTERDAYHVGMYRTGIITDQEPRDLDGPLRTSRDRRLEVQDKVPTSRLPGRQPVGRSGPTTGSGVCLSERDRPKGLPQHKFRHRRCAAGKNVRVSGANPRNTVVLRPQRQHFAAVNAWDLPADHPRHGSPATTPTDGFSKPKALSNFGQTALPKFLIAI